MAPSIVMCTFPPLIIPKDSLPWKKEAPGRAVTSSLPGRRKEEGGGKRTRRKRREGGREGGGRNHFKV